VRAVRTRALLGHHAGLVEIERVHGAAVHDPPHSRVERGVGDVADAVDVRRAHATIPVTGDRDLRREVVHDVDAFERPTQGLCVEDVDREELDVEALERGSVRAIDRAHTPTVVEQGAHQVGADVSRRSGDGGDHEVTTDA
jgi:hypothetical protein